jgi:hypothetical protein
MRNRLGTTMKRGAGAVKLIAAALFHVVLLGTTGS